MHSSKPITVHSNVTIREAMEVITTGRMRIALVTDNSKKLIGTLTDGDLRRGLLNGMDLKDRVEKIMSRDPSYCYEEDSHDIILKTALSKRLYQIPIVNKDGILVGLYRIDDLINPKEKTNPVVIMAGGQGVRLRPLTETTPKPLLNVGGRPILETIINNFKKQGFIHFFLSVNYKSEMIQACFGNGEGLDVHIEYIKEDHQMGTAGALSKLKGQIKETFIVMNGDILTNVNFNELLAFHQEHDAIATMGTRSYDHQIPYGVIYTDQGKITSIIEKPTKTSLVNAGIYTLNPTVLNLFEDNKRIDMPDVFESLIKDQQKVCAYHIQDYWADIGRLDELRKAESEFDEVF